MPIDKEDSELEALYAQFGRAAEMAQVMELEAGNLALAYALIAFDVNNLTNEEKVILKSVTEDVDRRTFGSLIRLIKKSIDIDQSIEDAISSALEKRNYLTHRFFRTHNFSINSSEGRLRMTEELSALFEELSQAHAILHGMTYTLNKVFGNPNITQEQAEKLFEQGIRVEI